jgi:hypothetical protein
MYNPTPRSKCWRQSCRCSSQRQRPPWRRAATRTKDVLERPRTTGAKRNNVLERRRFARRRICLVASQVFLPPWRPSCDSAAGRQRQPEKARGPMIYCHEELEADPAQQRRRTTTTTQQLFRLRLDPPHDPRMIMIVWVTICPRRKRHRPVVLRPVCSSFPKIPKSHPPPRHYYRRPLRRHIISTSKRTAGGTAHRHHRPNPNGRKYRDGVCRGF